MNGPDKNSATINRLILGRHWLVAGVCIFAACAIGGTCDSANPTIDPIVPADYRTTFTEVRNCRFSIEHDGVQIRVWANDIAMAAYLAEENPLPVGSIIVKEEFAGGTCDDDSELNILSVMRKEAAGFDNEDKDWHFQEVNPTSRVVITNTKTDCIECHRNDCSARDYMCTVE
ncbi:MAG: cytochrome P460 family protein [Planctomycetes bacterium]|nr:cytochrome P460 family protein [Planctomycetota bacterium]